MADITIVVTATKIKVLFNDLSVNFDGAIGATFKRSELIELWHYTTPIEHITLIMDTGNDWRLSLVGSDDILPITSIQVDGGAVVTPTTIEELHIELDKIFV